MREINLLLLSMSTIFNNPGETYYAMKDGSMVFQGASQLEVGTKYYLRKLQKEKKKIDRIFIISSKATREELRHVKGRLNDGFLPQGYDMEAAEVKTTALDFYERRIWQYIQGQETSFSTEAGTEKLREDVKWYEETVGNQEKLGEFQSLSELYTEGYELFCPVSLEDMEQDDGIYDTVNELCRKIRSYQKDGVSVYLYMDMQGARRYETFIMNAAVKMLEMSGIVLKASVANNFDKDNNSKGIHNQIVDTTINDRLFEMVSGMNEFIKTGRGDTLKEFWEHAHADGLLDMRQEEKLIGQIIRISNAIQLCNVFDFDGNLEIFGKMLEEYEHSKEKKQPLFESFVIDLKKDYEKYELFSADEKTRTVRQVKWCISKKLYQQALTLLESKIPGDIARNRLLYYGNHEQLICFINQLIQYGWDSFPQYMCVGKDYKKGIIPENAEFTFVKYVFDSKYAYERPELPRVGRKLYRLNVIQKKGYLNRKKGEQVQQVLQFLKKYYEIAALRNDINHAGGEIESTENLEKLLNGFVHDYEKLLKLRIDFDLSEFWYLEKRNRTQKDTGGK